MTPPPLSCVCRKEDLREHGRRGLRKVTWEHGDFPDDWIHARPLFSEMVVYLHRRVSVPLYDIYVSYLTFSFQNQLPFALGNSYVCVGIRE